MSTTHCFSSRHRREDQVLQTLQQYLGSVWVVISPSWTTIWFSGSGGGIGMLTGPLGDSDPWGIGTTPVLLLLLLYLSGPCIWLEGPPEGLFWGHPLEPRDQRAVDHWGTSQSPEDKPQPWNLKERMLRMCQKGLLLGPVDLNDFVASNNPAIPSRFLYDQSSKMCWAPTLCIIVQQVWDAQRKGRSTYVLKKSINSTEQYHWNGTQ